MHRLLPLALLAAACATDAGGGDTPAAALPVDAAGPSFSVLLGGGSQLTSGSSSLLEVSGAPAGSTVYFFLSTTGMGVGPCSPNGAVCLDLLRPTMLGKITASPDGRAQLTVKVPRSTSLLPAFLQAAVVSGASGAVSNPLVRVVDDRDMDFVLDGLDDCPDAFDPLQEDGDADGFGAACDCDDADDRTRPDATDTTFDGVDRNCDGEDAPGSFVEGSWEGTAEIELPDGSTCDGDLQVFVDFDGTQQVGGTIACTPVLPDGSTEPPLTFELLGSMADAQLATGIFIESSVILVGVPVTMAFTAEPGVPTMFMEGGVLDPNDPTQPLITLTAEATRAP